MIHGLRIGLRHALGVLGVVVAVAPAPAAAHGLWGHIHVTGWAVENMPDDSLREFLLDPEVFNALIFGATFTDTGYATSSDAAHTYAETTHWEPFIQDYVEWIRVNDPPPWTSIESKRRVAFLMGCASHGLQDELFDSLFLYQVAEQDGGDQDEADPGTDGFLALDEHLRFFPVEDVPLETLLELYASVDSAITAEVIEEAVGFVTDFYINDTIGPTVAAGLGEQYADDIPWTREHYLDADLPGSLRAEIYPTMHYQQALWDRLHEGLSADDAAVFAYPEVPRRLLSSEADSAQSWVSIVFGVGVRYEDDLVTLVDEAGSGIPTTSGNSRWGPEYTRVVRLMPNADLVPGAWYTAELRAGVETIDGQVSSTPYRLRFQVDCADGADDACADPIEATEPSIDGIVEVADDTGAEPVAADACGCGPGAPATPWFLLAAAWMGRRVRPRTRKEIPCS